MIRVFIDFVIMDFVEGLWSSKASRESREEHTRARVVSVFPRPISWKTVSHGNQATRTGGTLHTSARMPPRNGLGKSQHSFVIQ